MPVEEMRAGVVKCVCNASDVATAALSPSFGFARVRRNSSPAAGSASRERRVLRENQSRVRESRMRAPRAEVRSGQAMLRHLRLMSVRRHCRGHAVRLFAGRRRNFCRLPFFRAHSLAATSRSAPARLIPFELRRLVPRPRDEGRKGNSTGGFDEISLNDHCSPCAGRHSERHFAFG